MTDFAARNQPYVAPGPTSIRQGAPAPNYNTQLSPLDEMAFRQWLAQKQVPFDPNAASSDYDMRGFWQGLQQGNPRAQSAVNPNDQQMHYPDYWKTPAHQTFSGESQWAAPVAPQWNAQDQLVSPGAQIIKDERAPAQQFIPAPAQPTTRLQQMGSEGPVSAFAPNGQRLPDNFDRMVVPPYTQPPDRNTFKPDDVSSYRSSDNKTEDI